MTLAPWHAQDWQRLLARRAQDRLPHALLLSGAAGLGKRAFADAFVATLLCERRGEHAGESQGGEEPGEFHGELGKETLGADEHPAARTGVPDNARAHRRENVFGASCRAPVASGARRAERAGFAFGVLGFALRNSDRRCGTAGDRRTGGGCERPRVGCALATRGRSQPRTTR